MDTTTHTRLQEEIRTAPGKVAADYAALCGISTRMLFRWLRTDDDARQLVQQGFLSIEENKPVPDWAQDENGQVYPAIRTAQRTVKAPERDINALVVVPERLDDPHFDNKLDAFRDREIAKLGRNPKQSAVVDANMAIMNYKDLLRTNQKDQLLREAAEDAKSIRDDMIEEKDKRLAVQEHLIEQLQANLSPGRVMSRQPAVGRQH